MRCCQIKELCRKWCRKHYVNITFVSFMYSCEKLNSAHCCTQIRQFLCLHWKLEWHLIHTSGIYGHYSLRLVAFENKTFEIFYWSISCFIKCARLSLSAVNISCSLLKNFASFPDVSTVYTLSPTVPEPQHLYLVPHLLDWSFSHLGELKQ